MEKRFDAYLGCLLGLAAGDAMGCGVDGMTLEKIRELHGPGGLLGYDLLDGFAQTTSHTQAAAYRRGPSAASASTKAVQASR